MATIPAGSEVRLPSTVSVGDLALHGTIRIQTAELLVHGSPSGAGELRMEFGGSQTTGRGLVLTPPGAVSLGWTIRGHSAFNRTLLVTVRGEGAEVTYNGFFDHTGGGNRAYINALEGAVFIFGPDAVVNNQLPDWNARDFRLLGDGTGGFQFDPAFDADMGGTETNPVGGFSVFRMIDTTITTHASRNLPQIWKGAAGGIKHHGGLKVWGGDTAVWRVAGEPQYFDGGVAWISDWVLDTQADLTHTEEGRFETNLDDGWGPNWGNTDNTTLRKTGPARLILRGNHAYTPGSRYIIDEGVIEFHSNPDYSGDHPNPDAHVGPYLSLHLEANGQAAFFPEFGETHSLAGIGMADTSLVRLQGGRLHLVADFLLGAASTLRLDPAGLSSEGAPLITVGGLLSLAGTIVLENDAGDPPAAGTYALFTYGDLDDLSGLVDAEAPGMTAELRANPDTRTIELILSAGAEAETWPAWQALYFTPDEILQGLAEPTATPGGSGLANLLAYATGIHPRAPSTFSPLEISAEDGAPPALRFSRKPSAGDAVIRLYSQSAPGAPPDLLGESQAGQPFHPGSGTTSTESSLPDGRVSVEVAPPTPPSGRAFYFLEVDLSPGSNPPETP